jgi:hypothetical protein
MLFSIMKKRYPTERKRAKLLAALLTYSNVNINERDPSGMTAIHCAMQVRIDGLDFRELVWIDFGGMFICIRGCGLRVASFYTKIHWGTYGFLNSL